MEEQMKLEQATHQERGCQCIEILVQLETSNIELYSCCSVIGVHSTIVV
jgi:hypothetical protein